MDKKRNMKRRGLQLCLAAAMTLCLMLFVSGCAEKEVDMTMGETTVVEERAEITPVNLLVSEKVYPGRSLIITPWAGKLMTGRFTRFWKLI